MSEWPEGGIPADDMAMAEAFSKSIVDSEYEGWVAYVGGNPIYEARERPAGLYPVEEALSGIDISYRPPGRRTKNWRDLPHAKVHRVELYLRGANFESPRVIRLDRVHEDIRFLQMKEGGVAVRAAVRPGEADETGPRRLPVVAYRIGYWDPRRPQAVVWRIRRDGAEQWKPVANPWASRPLGYGLNPAAFGLAGDPHVQKATGG